MLKKIECIVLYITFWFINVTPNDMMHLSPAVEIKEKPPKAPLWSPPVVISNNIMLNSFTLSLIQRHVCHFICSFVQHVVQWSSVLIQTEWKKSGLLPSSLIWKQPLGCLFHVVMIIIIIFSSFCKCLCMVLNGLKRILCFWPCICGFTRGHGSRHDRDLRVGGVFVFKRRWIKGCTM